MDMVFFLVRDDGDPHFDDKNHLVFFLSFPC